MFMNPEKILETIFVVQYTPSSTATNLYYLVTSDNEFVAS